MRRMFLVLTLVAGPWLVAGCSDDDGGTTPPTNKCETEGKKRCNGTTIQACTKGSDELLDWVDESDCGATNLSCLDNGTTVECSAGCSDTCQTENATRCRGTEIETCTVGTDGCKAWVAGTNCADTSQICEETGGTAACAGACTDACPTAGDTQCSGTKIETCAIGGSGCLEWIAGYDCVTSNQACNDSSGSAVCEIACSGAAADIKNVTPADAATDVASTVDKLDWDDVTGAGSYAVYFGDVSITGQCPPPAYPDPAYMVTTDSEWPVTLVDNGSYCWKVVARDASGGCVADGAAYTFQTGCTDLAPGAPTVTTQSTLALAPGTTAGTVTLNFSEDVQNVSSSLTWTAVTGTRTQGAVTSVTGKTYTVAFSGLADGDEYTLVVGTGVTDTCGTALAAAVTITIKVISATGTAGTTCADALDITGAAGKIGLTGSFTDVPTATGTCTSVGSDVRAVWYTYTAATTGVHTFFAENEDTLSYSRLAVFETAACSPYGTEVSCDTATNEVITATATLTAGTTYLILFHTDDYSGVEMLNPKITVTAPTPPSQTPGDTCAKPIDITGKTFPFQVTGTFTEDPATGSSCDSTLYNAAWFSYSPPADGWYRLSAINSAFGISNMDIAIFEGTACDPYGTEVACAGSTTGSVVVLAYLEAAKTYTLLVAPDDAGEPHQDPLILIDPTTPGAGQTCDKAIDLTSATFPYTATGSFSWNPSANGSCDSTIYNGAWFKYTVTTAGWYEISGKLTQDTNDNADLVIFEGSACSPVGAEKACESSSEDTAVKQVYLTAGTYTILLASDSSSDDNTDPVINVKALTPAAGQACDTAIDITSSTFPYTATGSFTWTPHVTGSCYSSLYNAAWFKYTPTAAGWYDVSVQLTQSTSDDAELVIFEGSACFPPGLETACENSSSDTATSRTYLKAGTTYTLLMASDSSSDDNTDPVVNVTAAPTPTAGQACNVPIDLSSVTFPYTATGTFDWTPHVSVPCDSSNPVYSGAWFTYTPTSTGWYTVSGQLTQSTFDDARLTVYEGSTCFPTGNTLGCSAGTTDTGTALVQMTAGTTYTIMLAANSSSDDNTDPIIDIQSATAPTTPGLSCTLPSTTTSSNHSVNTSGYDCWTWSSDSTDDTNDHVFTCDSGVGGDVVVEYTTGATQTSLNFSGTIANFESSGYVRVEISEGSCFGGSSLYCTSSSSLTTDNGSVTVKPNTTYYIWVTDGFSGHYRPDVDLCLW